MILYLVLKEVNPLSEVKLFFGPQHPGMHGNASVHLYVEGDVVKKARLVPGMLHRGFEKSMENHTWAGNLALIPRVCVAEPDINELVFAQGVETIAEIEVPERAHYIRMIIMEMTRILAHMMSLGAIGSPTGLYTANQWMQADRNQILDLFEAITGHRVYHMYIVAGGVRKELPKGIEKRLLRFLEDFERRMPEYHALIFENPTIQARLKDNIMLPDWVVWELGVTGIGMRSAVGKPYDVRKVLPYARYDQVEFDVPVSTYSDAYTRTVMKYYEIIESMKIIRQSIDLMPEGKVRVPVAPGNALKWVLPKGQTYSVIESARGEFGYYMVSDGKTHPYRIAVRGASFPQGFLGIDRYMPGVRLDDAALWYDTMGICTPEIDR